MESERNEQQLEAEQFKITQLLKEHGIDTSSWGHGDAKTTAHLAIELLSGESQLVESENGEILRLVEVACGIIKYIDEAGKTFELAEDRQEFSDGRVRRREHLKGTSISEKMSVGEEPKEALLRGINEELGIEGGISIVGEPEVAERLRISQSFPGLKSQYRVYNFNVTISEEVYNPAGYKEEQKDKSTYFVWKEIEQ
jgi:hypothetical protein